MSLKIIDKRIAKLTTDAGKLNAYIHATAMLIVRHAKAHGDCTRALALVKAMPASMRRTMLRDWFAKHTPIVVKLDSGKGDEACGFSAKYVALKTPEAKAAAWKIEAADAEPFYMLADKVPEEKPFDLKALLAMAANLAKRIDGKIAEGKVPANDVAKAKEISAKIAAIAA